MKSFFNVNLLHSTLGKKDIALFFFIYLAMACSEVAAFLQTAGQNWAPATRKVAALPLFGKKSSGAAAYRYSNKKVAPLPLLACKTAAAVATLKK